MNTKKHIQADEFNSILFGHATVDQADEIASHVEECEQCRRTLDEMAAAPELWQKASKFINERYISDTVAIDSHTHFADKAPDGQATRVGTRSENGFGFSVESLLDKASHPEMMGSIGSYGIEREVGRGGMGVVLRAHDPELNRTVAIKVLAPHLASNGAARQRFAREARAAAGVLHPNVISIYGVDSTKKTPYIVMSYVPGPSLQRLVDQTGPLDLKELVRITMQISSGLAAAHSQGVIHRDIKPANILIEQGVSRVVITDFGLARAENDASMTRTGHFVGTPNFMSPEQAFGRALDGRSDLFSLGSVMYFMATGRMPFRADAPMAVLNRICNDTPTPVRQVNSDISKTFAEIIDKLLEKEPDARFQSAGELHQTLEQYLAYLHQPDISKPPVVREPVPKKMPWFAAAMVGLILMFVIAAGYTVNQFLNSSSGSPAPLAQSDDDSKVAPQTNQPIVQESLGEKDSDENTSVLSKTTEPELDEPHSTNPAIENRTYSEAELQNQFRDIELELEQLQRDLQWLDREWQRP